MKHQLDPRSTAAVLLREFRTPEQALRYSERMSRACHVASMIDDYMRASEDIREYMKGRVRP